LKKIKFNKNSGFTLVELLVVIAILGILAAVLLVGINPLEQTRKATDSGLLSKCKEVISAAERYYAFHQAEPANCAALITAQELKSGSCTGATLAGSGTTTYSCNFTATSTAFKAADKCDGATCTVPDDF